MKPFEVVGDMNLQVVRDLIRRVAASVVSWVVASDCARAKARGGGSGDGGGGGRRRRRGGGGGCRRDCGSGGVDVVSGRFVGVRGRC